MSVPSDIPAPQGVRNDDDLEVENMSVCSNKSGFLGGCLAPRPGPLGATRRRRCWNMRRRGARSSRRSLAWAMRQGLARFGR